MQQEITRVALDAMGGDNAPGELVKGAVDAVNGRSDIKVLLVGQQDVVEKELKQYSYPKEQIEVVHAEEVIETAEPPVNAIRKKKQSSIVVGMNMVKQMLLFPPEVQALSLSEDRLSLEESAELRDRLWHH